MNLLIVNRLQIYYEFIKNHTLISFFIIFTLLIMINIDFLNLKKYFSTKRNIVITTHRSPDGDALGSSLALYNILKELGHIVNIILPNKFPYFLDFLPFSSEAIIFEKETEKSLKLINEVDTFFFLDFNTFSRLDKMSDYVSNKNAYTILIDHHQDSKIQADQSFCDTNICSTAELVYDFIKKMDWNISKESAISLYTGIVTDSGSFKYPTVSSKTHDIVSNLLSFDIDHSLIHKNLFDRSTISRMRLLGKCISTNFKLYSEYNSAIIYLTKDDLKEYRFIKGDTEGFVNFPLSLDGVIFSVFFIEFDDGIKMSFRSKFDFDVNKFARKHFNGGGHKNAAGGKVTDLNLVQTIDYFSSLLSKYKSELS